MGGPNQNVVVWRPDMGDVPGEDHVTEGPVLTAHRQHTAPLAWRAHGSPAISMSASGGGVTSARLSRLAYPNAKPRGSSTRSSIDVVVGFVGRARSERLSGGMANVQDVDRVAGNGKQDAIRAVEQLPNLKGATTFGSEGTAERELLERLRDFQQSVPPLSGAGGGVLPDVQIKWCRGRPPRAP